MLILSIYVQFVVCDFKHDMHILPQKIHRAIEKNIIISANQPFYALNIPTKNKQAHPQLKTNW